jgi:hypothetical protein
MTEPAFYKIIPEVPPSYYINLFDFINSQYIVTQKQRFTDIIRQTTSDNETLSYVILDLHGKRLMQVEVKSGNPFELKVTPIDPAITQINL